VPVPIPDFLASITNTIVGKSNLKKHGLDKSGHTVDNHLLPLIIDKVTVQALELQSVSQIWAS